MRRFDGYIRVSDTKGRSGESFLSPDIQRDTIKRLAQAKGVELNEPIVRELDVSGGKRPEDRELGRLVERVESGESAGVIVWKLSRFSRSLLDAVQATTRITAAGGRLIADDFDSDQPMGKAMLGLLAGLAEEELDARREGFREARARAVERGVPNGRAPFGYRKRPDGRLEVVKAEAKIVHKVFKQRAEGVAFSQIGRERGWSHSTARQVLANVAYLGVARSGEYVNENAHPPIVTPQEFEAANAARTKQPVPPGETTKERFLLGLARCTGCGKTLKVVRRPRVDGSYAVSYYCKNQATEACPERAFVHADDLESFVAEWFTAALRTTPRMIDVVAVARELEDAQAEHANAQSELVAYVEAASALDAALFQRGLAKRQARLDAALALVRELSARVTSIPDGGGSLISLWGDFDAAERRDVLRGFLDRIEVTRGASGDLAGHVRIVWTDGSFVEVADDKERVGVAAA